MGTRTTGQEKELAVGGYSMVGCYGGQQFPGN